MIRNIFNFVKIFENIFINLYFLDSYYIMIISKKYLIISKFNAIKILKNN